MSEPRHLDLVDRLRGQYHLPVNDGAGPLNGSMTFSREFKTPPIQHEAADEIERLRERVADLQAKWGYTESIQTLEIERLLALLKEHGIKRHTVSGSDAAEDDDL